MKNRSENAIGNGNDNTKGSSHDVNHPRTGSFGALPSITVDPTYNPSTVKGVIPPTRCPLLVAPLPVALHYVIDCLDHHDHDHRSAWIGSDLHRDRASPTILLFNTSFLLHRSINQSSIF